MSYIDFLLLLCEWVKVYEFKVSIKFIVGLNYSNIIFEFVVFGDGIENDMV